MGDTGGVPLPRDVVILGSTGSIGTQALDVVSRNADRFSVVGLAAHGSRPELLAEQALAHGVDVIAVTKAGAANDVLLALYAVAQRRGFAEGEYRVPKIITGPTAAEDLAAMPCDVVLNGMAGAAGLGPTVAALRAGRALALANKESLIIGGPVVTRLAAPGQIVPVDSEHSALAQALRGGRREEVARLVLTASGGPFRGVSREQLDHVTPEQALDHPTWRMGPLVTVNSATLVNKGLEVIEAHLLFDMPFERIDVVVHPQSVVHSLVEFTDGSTLAQASPPDMRLPIALGMSWPERVPQAAPACDWSTAATWEFFPLDRDAFPAVDLAEQAGRAGGTAPAVYNGANEVLVQAFLDARLSFTGIVDGIRAALAEHQVDPDGNTATLSDVIAADAWARAWAEQLLDRREQSAGRRGG